jgi:hypothetical protein
VRGLPIGAVWVGLALASGLALGGCWTGSPPPPPLSSRSSGASEAPARILRVPRARSRGGLGRRPPPRLTPEQRRFPPELRAVRADAYGCAQRHKVSIARTLFLEVSIDAAGAVTAARAAGFGVAEPCVLSALRARRFVAYTDTTISLTIPWASGHPAP